MTERATILESIKSLRSIRQEFSSRLDRIESELLRLLDTTQESQPLPQSNTPEEWLTAHEVCEALKISQTAFYNFIRDGKLPEGVAFSAKSKRWRMSDILAWQSKNHDEPEQENISHKRRGRVSRIVRLDELRRA